MNLGAMAGLGIFQGDLWSPLLKAAQINSGQPSQVKRYQPEISPNKLMSPLQ